MSVKALKARVDADRAQWQQVTAFLDRNDLIGFWKAFQAYLTQAGIYSGRRITLSHAIAATAKLLSRLMCVVVPTLNVGDAIVHTAPLVEWVDPADMTKRRGSLVVVCHLHKESASAPVIVAKLSGVFDTPCLPDHPGSGDYVAVVYDSSLRCTLTIPAEAVSVVKNANS